MSKKREHERALFSAFLAVAPNFAGEPLADWHQPEDESDFPDIIGESATGQKIGVELGEWLNENEIQAAKHKERLEAAFLEAIGDQGQNPTQHIRYVWLHPKLNAKIGPNDGVPFRDQVFAFITACDQRWPNERFWKVGPCLSGDDFVDFPLLAKYLDGITLWPADGERWERNWITFPMRVDTFNRDTMFVPLREIITAKIGHYGATRSGFDRLFLLVIYNQAAIYNSPAETPLHTYDGAVAELKQLIGENRGPFDRVLLYIAIDPGGRVLQVC